MNHLQLYRAGNPTITFPIDEQTTYLDECMGRFDIQCQTSSSSPLDIKVDDYIIYNGVRFTINVPFQVNRSAFFEYQITFEHPSYWLKDIAFKHLGSVEFSYFGNPQSFLNLICENMNVDDSGWQVGEFDIVEEKNIDFYASGQGYSCKGALQHIAEIFELEYWFSGDGKTINLTQQAGKSTNINFAYGRSKGLYSVERGIIETPLFNRIYGFGGTKNLRFNYRGGSKRLVFEERFIERALMPGERRRETSIIFEDIFPERTGTISAVPSTKWSVLDSSIDFDLNGSRLDGEQAKIVFKSGELSGQEFEISSYNHSSKTIRFKQNTDANGYILPNSTFSPKVGDKYTLIGISQPASYIADAESRLKAAVDKAFKQRSRPPYRVEIDEKYMRENGFTLKSGDRVTLVDKALGIDDKIRVTSVSFPLVNPNKCTVVISDSITYTQTAEFIIDQGKIKEEVKVVDKNLSEYNRKQSVAISQFKDMVFDPDGNLTGTIQTLMVEAMSAYFGSDSQNFDLQGIFIKANADGNANKITFTSGQLVHHSYSIDGLGNTWNMAPYINNSLTPATAYYITAKVSKTSLTGEWVFSTAPIGVDDVAGFWHFNLGVISSVVDGQRFTNITKGYTFITGGQILTERLIAQYLRLPQMTIGRDGENVQRFYYDLAQTKTAIAFGLINGKQQLIWYDENGVEIWNASKNGIVYVTSTPESITPWGLKILQSTPTVDTSLSIPAITTVVQANAVRSGSNAYIGSESVYYNYNPGANDNTEANSVYEGYHTLNDKTSPFIPNGYYAFTGINPNYDMLMENPDNPNHFIVPVYQFWNGKVVGNQANIDIYIQ